jgi:hypothetical protein
MTKWSGRSRQFSVKIYYTPRGRGQITIPKPILDNLGKPDTVIFTLGTSAITVDFIKTTKNA